MKNYVLEELKEMIIKKYGSDERGCYINGYWFSPQDIILMINKLDKEN